MDKIVDGVLGGVLQSILKGLPPRDLIAFGLCSNALLEFAQAGALEALARGFPGAATADGGSATFELLWRWEFKYSCTAAAMDQADKQAVRELVASLGLADQFASSEAYGAGDEKKFFAHWVPSLRMEWGELDDYSHLGASRVQGIPDLPRSWEWPTADTMDWHDVKPWGAEVDQAQGLNCVEGLKERVKVAQIAEGRTPMMFLAQVNLADAKAAWVEGDTSRSWPLPSQGILYYFTGEWGRHAVLFYDGSIGSDQLIPTHPSVFGGQMASCATRRHLGAKRYIFSRAYTLLADRDDEDYIHEDCGPAISARHPAAALSGDGDSGLCMMGPGADEDAPTEAVVLLRDNCGFQFGDCQSLFVTIPIQDLLRRNFGAVAERPSYPPDSQTAWFDS